MTEILAQKRCCRCRKVKPVTEFHKNKNYKDGLSYECKACKSEISKEYHKKHPDKIRERAKEWRAKSPEKARARNKRWYENHKNESFAATLNWVSRNIKKVIERRKVYKRNYKSRKRNAEGSITSREWLELCSKYENKCLRCGRSDVKLTIDHVKPLSLGGSNAIDNIQPLCMSCNASKQDKWIDYR